MGSLKNTLDLQFRGFLATPPLWKDSGPINIHQYPMHSFPPAGDIVDDISIPDNLILGKRIEYFFACYIKHFTSDMLIGRNVVINQEKRTLGEIDFLLLDPENKEYMHVEVVYKFYLYAESEIAGESWIGPNRKDSLQRKLLRLREHQFPLLYRKESEAVIRDLGLPLDQISQKICFKASLFVPLGMSGRKFPGINNECVRGFWIKLEDFKERDYGHYQFHSPKKPDWPVDPKDWTAWSTFKEVKELIIPLLLAKRSPLLWMKKNDQEFVRFFVVWW